MMTVEVRTSVQRRSKSVPSNNFEGLPPDGNDYDVATRLAGKVVWRAPSGGGGGGGATNLTITFSTTTVIIANDNGTGGTITAATASQAGAMTNAMFVKLRDIATAATANQSDAYLLDRDHHSGVQAISTINGLQTALDYFTSELNNKVNVVIGKQLSTEDYSTAEKNKLFNIAPGATANASDAALRDRSTHTGQQAISTVTNLQTTLDSKLNANLVGVANGLVPLDNNVLIPSIYLPSFVDDVLEFTNLAAFPGTGESGKIYVALDTNKTYRWGGSSYTFITSGAVDSVNGKTGVITLYPADLGLGNVDNTSDMNKPVSTAQASAIAAKENAISPGSAGQYYAYDKTWKTLNAAAIGLVSADVIAALGFTPYSATNPAGYITANQTITITGDATGSGTTSITLSIGNNKVTNGMLAQVASKTFKGRTSASAGNVEDLTAAQATDMLNTFTYSAKGLVPAPGGSGSTKFLREDGSWQNVTVTFSNSVAVDSKIVAGRALLEVLHPSNLSAVANGLMQHALYKNRMYYAQAMGGGSTSVDVVGYAAPTNTGATVTGRSLATTNFFTRLRRVGYVSAATAGSLVSTRFAAVGLVTFGNGAGLGGFFKSIRFGCSDAATVSGARQYAGITTSASNPSNVEPSTLTNHIGVGHGAADTNLKLFYGGSAAQTPVDLGANFPANTLSTDAYELILYSPSYLDTTVYWQVTRLNTGDVASGNIVGTSSAILPASTAFMLPSVLWRSNNATALAVALDFMFGYFDTEGF